MRVLQRNSQSGSVATFVITGVILASLLVGAVYFLNKRSEQVRKDNAIAAYDQKKADEKAAESTKAAEASKETEKPKETTAPVVTTTNTNSDMDTTSVKLPTSTPENSEKLPITGPESAISDFLAVFLLTTAIAGYIASRRNLLHSL